MPDEPPLCDPDRMVFEDLDMTDLDVISAYLQHPTTEALVEDLGRSFRQLPASQQRPEVVEYLTQLKADRDRVNSMLDDSAEAGPIRDSFEALLDKMNSYIDWAKLRLHRGHTAWRGYRHALAAATRSTSRCGLHRHSSILT